MKLYVCWGTFGFRGHACGKAYEALREAGHDPEVKKTYGWPALPDIFNRGRADVVELSGQKWVPVLVTDSGETIVESGSIVHWAEANPAGAG